MWHIVVTLSHGIHSSATQCVYHLLAGLPVLQNPALNRVLFEPWHVYTSYRWSQSENSNHNIHTDHHAIYIFRNFWNADIYLLEAYFFWLYVCVTEISDVVGLKSCSRIWLRCLFNSLSFFPAKILPLMVVSPFHVKSMLFFLILITMSKAPFLSLKK